MDQKWEMDRRLRTGLRWLNSLLGARDGLQAMIAGLLMDRKLAFALNV